MATNIRNKADEVLWWIEKHRETPTPKQIRAYVEYRWPRLLATIKADIVSSVLENPPKERPIS